MCSKADETINHIVSECPKLAQREYKKIIGPESIFIGKFVERMKSMLT